MEPGLITLVLFAFLGSGIKVIDRAYDEGDVDKGLALLLVPFLALFWVHLSTSDGVSATILGAIFLSSLLAGKIDNMAFRLSALIIGAAFLVNSFEIMILPLLFLALLGFFDELANEYADRNKPQGLKGLILKHRFGMKAGVVVLFALGFLGLTHVLALYAFDLAYEAFSIIRIPSCRAAATRIGGV